MPSRDKHPRKEIEKLLREAEERDFVVTTSGKGKSFKVKCNCAEGHLTFIHRTPGKTLANRKRNEIEKWPCWKGAKP
jgi:hypothetical protein